MELLVWLLPIVSGACDAGSRGVIKATSIHRFTLVAAGYLFALPWYFVWLWFDGMPHVDPKFWLYVGVHVPLLVFAQVLTVESHRLAPLTLTMPYLGLTPVAMLVTSPLMGGGSPTWWGVAGIVAIGIGLLVIQPPRALMRQRASQLMIVVSMIFAITANLDYLALRASSSPFYLLIDHGFAGTVSMVVALCYLAAGRATRSEISPAGVWVPLLGFSVLTAASVISQMLTFRWVTEVPYVIATKRIGAMGFTIALGIGASVAQRPGFEHEREQLRRRLVGIVGVAIGMALVILFGKEVSP